MPQQGKGEPDQPNKHCHCLQATSTCVCSSACSLLALTQDQAGQISGDGHLLAESPSGCSPAVCAVPLPVPVLVAQPVLVQPYTFAVEDPAAPVTLALAAATVAPPNHHRSDLRSGMRHP